MSKEPYIKERMAQSNILAHIVPRTIPRDASQSASRRVGEKLVLTTCLVLAVLLTGCAVGVRMQGERYLRDSQFKEGEAHFASRIAEKPADAQSNYYLGRFLLAQERFEEAYPKLQQAVLLNPNTADYHFWLGVSQWSLGRFEAERQSYLKSLSLDPQHLEAHTYLGHNYLDRGEYVQALSHYEAVLALSKHHPEALYNKGLAQERMGKTDEALATWKLYLKHYPDGALGRSAIQYLNANGDFTYRLHALGIRRVPLEWIKFNPGSCRLDRNALPSLRTVGAFMSQDSASRLIIESYYRDNPELAATRAESIRQFILSQFPSVDPKRLKMQSFSRPERIQAGDKLFALDSSIVFKTVTGPGGE